MPTLLEIPLEVTYSLQTCACFPCSLFLLQVLIQILLFLPPPSLANLAQTCSDARAAIYGPSNSPYLWQSLYLDMFDDPRSNGWAISSKEEAPRWKEDYQGAMEALNRWGNGFIENPRKEVIETNQFFNPCVAYLDFFSLYPDQLYIRFVFPSPPSSDGRSIPAFVQEH